MAISTKHTPGILEQWMKMCEEFDKDTSKPNPYEEPQVRKSSIVYFSLVKADSIYRCYLEQAEANAGCRRGCTAQ